MAKAKSTSARGNRFLDYWGKHAHYTCVVHIAMGIGIGLLLQPNFAANGTTTLVAWALILLGLLSHLYALVA